MATTLVDFWTAEQTTYKTARDTAQAALATSQGTLANAQKATGDAVSALAALQTQIDAIKRKLAIDVSPADADADVKKLRALVASLRDQSGVVLRAKEDQFEAQLAVDAANARLTATSAKLTEATTALAAAQAKSDKLAAWTVALGASPLSTVIADAAAAVAQTAAQTPRGDAAARISNDFPDSLKTAAAARRAAQKVRFDHLAGSVGDTRALLVAHLAGHTSTLDAVDAARLDYDAAWTALATYVQGAKEDFDRALALYASVSSAPPLTAEEVADIKAGPAQTDGEAALAPAEKERDAALVTVYDDTYALEKATTAKLAPDPTVPLPVLAEQTTLTADEATLADKENAFSNPGTTPTPKQQLDAWEASLPDTAYRSLVAFQEADEVLTALKNSDPVTLRASVVSSDGALAAALLGAAKAARTAEYLRTTLTQQSQRLDHAREVRQDRLFSYVRGDT